MTIDEKFFWKIFGNRG